MMQGKLLSTHLCCKSVLSNHLNGRDTHVRQIKLYSRRPCVRLSLPCCFIVHDEELCLIFLNLCTAEPYSTSAISVYFKGVQYLCFYQIRNVARHRHMERLDIEFPPYANLNTACST